MSHVRDKEGGPYNFLPHNFLDKRPHILLAVLLEK